MNTDFEIGQDCCYEGILGKLKVQVVNKKSRGDVLEFQLGVTEVLERSRIRKTPKTGDIFRVSKKRGCPLESLIWELKPML